MTAQERWVEWLLSTANEVVSSFTMTVRTGTTCAGCLSQDENIVQYSKVWHKNNPEEPECKGTLLTDRSSTTANLKGIIFPPSSKGEYRRYADFESIGKINEGDLFLIGTADADNSVFYSLSGKTNKNSWITFNGQDYQISGKPILASGGVSELTKIAKVTNQST